MMKITSPSNPRIKKIVKLKTRKARDLSGLSIIDGIREVTRALEAKASIEEIFMSPEVLMRQAGQAAVDNILSWGIPVTEVSKEVLSKISFGDRLEGVVAICKPKTNKISQLRIKENPFLVILENVEKPGNLGAILRTCDGAGVDALILCESKIDIFNPNTIRSSIGAVFSVPVYQATNQQALNFCKENNITILSACPQGQQTYYTADLKGSLAIVLGREDTGLSEFWSKASDIKASIPMRGKADSLNVSNAAAILIYEALRQRR